MTVSAIQKSKTRKVRQRGRPSFDASEGEAARKYHALAARCPIDRAASTPLWVQLKLTLERAIRTGALPESGRLPSEQAMCEMFDLSRQVVRAALGALAAEGLVIKQPRRGMYVAPRRHDFSFVTSAISLIDDLSARGYQVTEKTFEYGLQLANDEERRALNLPEGFQVLRILRVFCADGASLTHTCISLPAHRVPGMEKMNMDGKSILGTIHQMYGLAVERADRWISATVIDREAAIRMNLPENTPILKIKSVGYDHSGNPLEYYDAYYNTEVAPIHIATDGTAVASTSLSSQAPPKRL